MPSSYRKNRTIASETVAPGRCLNAGTGIYQPPVPMRARSLSPADPTLGGYDRRQPFSTKTTGPPLLHVARASYDDVHCPYFKRAAEGMNARRRIDCHGGVGPAVRFRVRRPALNPGKAMAFVCGGAELHLRTNARFQRLPGGRLLAFYSGHPQALRRRTLSAGGAAPHVGDDVPILRPRCKFRPRCRTDHTLDARHGSYRSRGAVTGGRFVSQ